MNFLRLKPTHPLYYQGFGDTDIRNFEAYTDRKETIGKIVDVLSDEAQRTYYLVIEVGSWLSRKQVLLPLSQFQVAPNERRLYALGVSKAEVENLPAYAARELKGNEARRVESTASTAPATVFEASAPLEASLPLESSRLHRPVTSTSTPVTAPVAQSPLAQPIDHTAPLPTPTHTSSELTHSELLSPVSRPVAEETVRLLEERLIVDRKRRKIGDVIVRKTVETRMVEVPVRWEKLIVEQVSPERKQLASIDLHQQPLTAETIDQNALNTLELREPTSPTNGTDTAQYIPINLANQVLYKLTQFPQFSSAQVKMAFADPELQAQYQRWLTERKNP